MCTRADGRETRLHLRQPEQIRQPPPARLGAMRLRLHHYSQPITTPSSPGFRACRLYPGHQPQGAVTLRTSPLGTNPLRTNTLRTNPLRTNPSDQCRSHGSCFDRSRPTRATQPPSRSEAISLNIIPGSNLIASRETVYLWPTNSTPSWNRQTIATSEQPTQAACPTCTQQVSGSCIYNLKVIHAIRHEG